MFITIKDCPNLILFSNEDFRRRLLLNKPSFFANSTAFLAIVIGTPTAECFFIEIRALSKHRSRAEKYSGSVFPSSQNSIKRLFGSRRAKCRRTFGIFRFDIQASSRIDDKGPPPGSAPYRPCRYPNSTLSPLRVRISVSG